MERLQWIAALLLIAQSHSFVSRYQGQAVSRRLRPCQMNDDGNTSDASFDLGEDEAWESSLELASKPYVSSVLESQPQWSEFMESLQSPRLEGAKDPLWEMIKTEALHSLGPEPEAGPQVYLGILSKPSLMEAVVTIISHEIETELIPATSIKNLFDEMLTPQDEVFVHLDVMAVTMRSPGAGNAMTATLFHRGFHALVCYRLGHRLWLEGRKGLAYYMQSVVSRKFSADIHPAAKIAGGIYLSTGGGIVIGETAVVGPDTSILQGVTLGGTGKEAGNRHPKVGNGVILQIGATVLGNIVIGDGSVVLARSIVTKPVPPLARVGGVPAKIKSYRNLDSDDFENDDLERDLGIKYLDEWQEIANAAAEDVN